MVDQLYSQIVWNVFRNNEFYRLRMKSDFVHVWGVNCVEPDETDIPSA
jgi:hypothetical protein